MHSKNENDFCTFLQCSSENNLIKVMPGGHLKWLVFVSPLEIIYQRCVMMTPGFSNGGKENREGNLAIDKLEIDPFHVRVKAFTA